jgi:DNA polymerase I-like protein with 3'-5' exonuclease and polymerase domains
MLKFWVSPKARSDAIAKTFGATLKAMRPNVPVHEFVTIGGEPLMPGPGEIVMVCGTAGLELLKAHGLIPKNRTLNSMREKPYRVSADGGYYFMTFDPGIIASEPAKRAIIDWDVRLAHRFLTTGSLDPVLGDYRWVGSFAPMIERIKARFANTGLPVDVSCDTETMGLYPYEPGKEIITIGFTDRPHYGELLYLGPMDDPVDVDPDEPLLNQIKWLLTSEKVKIRGSNFKYDLVWIAEKWGIECTNFKFDNALAGSLVDENRSNGLDTHAKAMSSIGGYADKFNAKHDKDKMELVALDDMLPYAAGDLDAEYQVADVLRDELLEDPQLARFYVRVLHPASRAFEKIERRGIVIDREKYAVLGDDLGRAIKKGEAAAMELLGGRLKAKFMDKIVTQRAEGKSPLTPAVIKEYFFGPLGLGLKPMMLTGKTGEPSTARAHLRMFADNREAHAMCGLLEEIGSAAKTKSTFVDGFLRHVRHDERLHPSYMLFHGGFNDDESDESGTVSGRLSARDPPIQTLPSKTKWANRLRECYIAPPGMVVLVADFSQGELKVVACIAPEKTMLNAYDNGLDLHAVTGAKLGGFELAEFLTMKTCGDPVKEAVYSLTRAKAKPANFGLLFGMQAEGFRAYCWAQYSLKLTFKEAEGMRNAFFELYPGLLDYHDAMKKFVRAYQHVRTPMGRVRHLDTIRSWDRSVVALAERQSINSPVQGTLTDMMIWALAEIEANLDTEECQVVGMIHDSLIAYVPQAKLQHYAQQVTDIMKNLPLLDLGWVPQLLFTADAETGPNMANLSKVKLIT